MGFSVVIPVHNKRPHLERTIRSIASQQLQPDEVIVIDDCSSDGSRAFLEQKPIDLKLLFRDTPGPGGYAARNLGIQEAQHEWIVFLDADDEWGPGYLKGLADAIQQFPHAAVIGSAWAEYTPEKGFSLCDYRKTHDRFEEIDADTYLRMPSRSYPTWTSAVAIRRRLLLEVGGFPAGLVKRGGDVDTWMRCIITSGWMLWCPMVQAVYRKDSVNMVTKSVPFEKRAERFSVDRESTRPGITRKRLRSLEIFATNRIVSGYFQAVRQGMPRLPSPRPKLSWIGTTGQNLPLVLSYRLPPKMAEIAFMGVVLLQGLLGKLGRLIKQGRLGKVLRFLRDTIGLLSWTLKHGGMRFPEGTANLKVSGFSNTFFGDNDTRALAPDGDNRIVLLANRAFPLARHSSKVASSVVVVDRQSGKTSLVGETTAWNWQQGSRQQWVSAEKVVFNAVKDHRVCAKVVDLSTGAATWLSHPLQSWSPGLYATLNFGVLARISHNDYGYPLEASDREVYLEVRSFPQDSALHRIVFSQVANLCGPPANSREHHFNHVLFSPSGRCLVFLYRCTVDSVLHHWLIHFNLDTSELSVLIRDQMVSHYTWLTDHELVYWGHQWGVPGYYVLSDKGTVRTAALTKYDGHPSRSASGRILTDTYKLGGAVHRLFSLDLETGHSDTVLQVPEAPFYYDSTRCDLHAKPNGRWLQLDTRLFWSRRARLVPFEGNSECQES